MTDLSDDTHAQNVPPEFIPEGYIQLTDYEGDLPALAEDIAVDVDPAADVILGELKKLIEYKVPVVEAERVVRSKYGGGEL